MKSKGTAYLLWFFFGFLGIHKFYLDKAGMGLLYLFTFGLFGIGWFIDLFTLGDQVDTYNALYYRQFPNYNNVFVNVPPVQQQPQNNQLSLTDQLNKLHELKEKGVLTEEEFAGQKKKLLG